MHVDCYSSTQKQRPRVSKVAAMLFNRMRTARTPRTVVRDCTSAFRPAASPPTAEIGYNDLPKQARLRIYPAHLQQDLLIPSGVLAAEYPGVDGCRLQ